MFRYLGFYMPLDFAFDKRDFHGIQLRKTCVKNGDSTSPTNRASGV